MLTIKNFLNFVTHFCTKNNYNKRFIKGCEKLQWTFSIFQCRRNNTTIAFAGSSRLKTGGDWVLVCSKHHLNCLAMSYLPYKDIIVMRWGKQVHIIAKVSISVPFYLTPISPHIAYTVWVCNIANIRHICNPIAGYDKHNVISKGCTCLSVMLNCENTKIFACNFLKFVVFKFNGRSKWIDVQHTILYRRWFTLHVPELFNTNNSPLYSTYKYNVRYIV